MDMGTQNDDIKQQHACPSCLFYCELKIELELHINVTHLNKRSHEEGGDTAEPTKKDKIVSIPGERHVYTFAAADEIFVPNLPKFTADSILKLSDIVMIIMPGNRFLSDKLKKVVEAEAIDQQSLKSLKQFPSVYQLLQSVLQQPYEELPYALWTYRLPSSISLTERQLTRIVQFVLTEYANKSNRRSEYISKSERTFWIDRVVPLLQTLGDQTGLLGFEWCETVADEQVESNILPESWSQGGVRYLDGRGYDQNGRNRIVMESSSGPATEKMEHTLNDTIKNMHNSIALLEAVIRPPLQKSAHFHCSLFVQL
ncbi:hypothetical protein VTP01DRAFT_782 [Rhizomucor pusillus]|uniref:uncharacterized protein n=1 Tax=Rhizomucor pusillus TaxID=4840 RepID=UPI003743BD84